MVTFLHLCRLSLAQGTSDFCVAPDTFILNMTEGQLSTGNEPARLCVSQTVPLYMSFSPVVTQPLPTPPHQVQLDPRGTS